jgi:hypothetical protein
MRLASFWHGIFADEFRSLRVQRDDVCELIYIYLMHVHCLHDSYLIGVRVLYCMTHWMIQMCVRSMLKKKKEKILMRST